MTPNGHNYFNTLKVRIKVTLNIFENVSQNQKGKQSNTIK